MGELITAAAKQYGVKAMGVTLSEEQYAKTSERIKQEGLTDLVEVSLLDYRDIKNRKFDKIVSVGMIEHVGKDNITQYFETVNALLNDGGISLLHCITSRPMVVLRMVGLKNIYSLADMFLLLTN